MESKSPLWAVVTGASSGIGYEFAKLFAQDGIPLVLVAKNEQSLDRLAQDLQHEYHVQTLVCAVDLSTEDSVEQVYDLCKQQQVAIGYLINSAGFGEYGNFTETSWKKESSMIDVNCKALTLLCKRFGSDMVREGRGHIVNMASVAAFTPGPYMAVYYATKAYVLSLSEALAEEWKASGVQVMALCPGPTDSGFAATAGAERTGLFNAARVPSAAQVAMYGYKQMQSGAAVALYPRRIRIGVASLRFLPRSYIRRLAARVLRPT